LKRSLIPLRDKAKNEGDLVMVKKKPQPVEGVEVIVQDDVAYIDFVDSSKRGRGLAALLAVTPAESIVKLSRWPLDSGRTGLSSPRPVWRVPAAAARAAGLLSANEVDEFERPAADSLVAPHLPAPSYPTVTAQQAWVGTGSGR